MADVAATILQVSSRLKTELFLPGVEFGHLGAYTHEHGDLDTAHDLLAAKQIPELFPYPDIQSTVENVASTLPVRGTDYGQIFSCAGPQLPQLPVAPNTALRNHLATSHPCQWTSGIARRWTLVLLDTTTRPPTALGCVEPGIPRLGTRMRKPC
jgi:hypothetical protein